MEEFTTIVRAIPVWSWALGCLLIALIGLAYWWRLSQEDLRERVMMAVWQLQLEHRDNGRYTRTPILAEVYWEVRYWGTPPSFTRLEATLSELVRRGQLVSVENVPQADSELSYTTYCLPEHASH